MAFGPARHLEIFIEEVRPIAVSLDGAGGSLPEGFVRVIEEERRLVAEDGTCSLSRRESFLQKGVRFFGGSVEERHTWAGVDLGELLRARGTPAACRSSSSPTLVLFFFPAAFLCAKGIYRFWLQKKDPPRRRQLRRRKHFCSYYESAALQCLGSGELLQGPDNLDA